MTENVITIDGKDYAPEDMNEQQTYLINQIRSCQQNKCYIKCNFAKYFRYPNLIIWKNTSLVLEK